MFSTEEYITGWLIYLVAVVGLLVLTWQLTKPIPWLFLKQSLRLTVASLLLVPATVENAAGLLAPAWIKALLTLIFTGVESFFPTGHIILIAWLSAAFVYVLLLLLLLLYRRYFPAKEQTDSEPR